MDPAALAAESEAYGAFTISADPVRATVIVATVKEACALLEAEGPAAFPKFSGRGSPFVYGGTYVWVHAIAALEIY